MKKKLEELNRGDIFKEAVKDATGSEQKGHRPLVVISDHFFNQLNGYVLVCPISNGDYTPPDGIRVNTKHSTITGWILTQHLTPFHALYIRNPTQQVIVEDEMKNDSLKECLDVLKAITSYSEFSTKKYQQGEIVEVGVGVSDTIDYALVVSENSFNDGHNSIWVAPISVESNSEYDDDQVLIKDTDFFGDKYGIISLADTRNIHPAARKVRKANANISKSTLQDCLHILSIFFEEV